MVETEDGDEELRVMGFRVVHVLDVSRIRWSAASGTYVRLSFDLTAPTRNNHKPYPGHRTQLDFAGES